MYDKYLSLFVWQIFREAQRQQAFQNAIPGGGAIGNNGNPVNDNGDSAMKSREELEKAQKEASDKTKVQEQIEISVGQGTTSFIQLLRVYFQVE